MIASILLCLSMSMYSISAMTCGGGSTFKNCGTACPRNCCTNDFHPSPCTYNCVERCQCSNNKVEIYKNNAVIDDCKNPSRCPKCPISMGRNCDLHFDTYLTEYNLAVSGSGDPPQNALLDMGSLPGGPSIDVNHNGVYTITKNEDFYVKSVGFIVSNVEKVILKGFNLGGTKVFQTNLKIEAVSNPNGGSVPGGFCTLPKKKVRSLTLKFKANNQNQDVNVRHLIVNACCAFGFAPGK